VPRGRGSWPRQDYPLVPLVLRDCWVEEEIPSTVLKRAGLKAPATFGDLDTGVWLRLGNPHGICLLANYIVSEVTARLYHGADSSTLAKTIFPKGMRLKASLERLPFSKRTSTVVRRCGRLHDVEGLASITVKEFLRLPNAGVVTFLDFATVVENYIELVESETDECPSDEFEGARLELECLKKNFPVRTISAGDPRLAGLKLARGSSVEAALEHMLEASVRSNPKLAEFRKTLALTKRTLKRLAEQPLDEALAELLAITTDRHKDTLAFRLGWDGRGGATLERAGAAAGITRERVRQLERRLGEKLREVVFLPALDNAIRLLDEAADGLKDNVVNLLMGKGLVAGRFLPQGVATAARMLGKPHRFRVSQDGESVELESDEHLHIFRQVLRSLGDMRHVATVAEFVARLKAQYHLDVAEASAKSFLNRKCGVVWLDRDRTWFWDGCSSSYINMARKVLAVSSEISLESLRAGVLRHHRTRNMSLPRTVFRGLCRAAGFQVDGERVRLGDALSLDQVLGNIELIFVRVLRRNNNVMGTFQLRDACVAEGINHHSFWSYLSYSPLLVRVGPGAYALRGAPVDPIDVVRIIGEPVRHDRCLEDHGWTRDGAVWLAYRVTRSVRDSGVVAVPPGVRKIVGTREFELLATDGTAMGILNVGAKRSAGSAWGLRGFINRRGVDLKDYVVLALDTELEVAIIQAGTEDVLEAYQEGRGRGPRDFLEEMTKPSES